MQKLAAGWVAPSSSLPAMDAGLAQSTSKGMQGSGAVGAVPGRPRAAAIKMDKAPKAPKVQPKMDKESEGKIPASELKKGIKVEKEHKDTVGNDPAKFKSIAKDHLEERPDYYTQLAKMEAKPVENTMKDAEIRGFIDKCAELGVDPTVAIQFTKKANIMAWLKSLFARKAKAPVSAPAPKADTQPYDPDFDVNRIAGRRALGGR